MARLTHDPASQRHQGYDYDRYHGAGKVTLIKGHVDGNGDGDGSGEEEEKEEKEAVLGVGLRNGEEEEETEEEEEEEEDREEEDDDDDDLPDLDTILSGSRASDGKRTASRSRSKLQSGDGEGRVGSDDEGVIPTTTTTTTRDGVTAFLSRRLSSAGSSDDDESEPKTWSSMRTQGIETGPQRPRHGQCGNPDTERVGQSVSGNENENGDGLGDEDQSGTDPRPHPNHHPTSTRVRRRQDRNKTVHKSERRSEWKTNSVSRTTTSKAGARFILHEAACEDDNADNNESIDGDDDDKDDEYTDLSGFIVDDDAELSFFDTELESEREIMDGSEKQRVRRKRRATKRRQSSREQSQKVAVTAAAGKRNELESAGGRSSDKVPTRRGYIRMETPSLLDRWKLERQDEEDDDKDENGVDQQPEAKDVLADAIAKIDLGTDRKQSGSTWIKAEPIDLTLSPFKPSAKSLGDSSDEMQKRKRPSPRPTVPEKETTQQREDPSLLIQGSKNAPGDDDHYHAAILRFSPPTQRSPIKIDKDKKPAPFLPRSKDPVRLDRAKRTATPPPHTPPASPTKLNSPSKKKNILLSPSQRAVNIPPSPHRQSIDAFWSSDVINEWNEQYSPPKPPLSTSLKKRGLVFGRDVNDRRSESEGGCDVQDKSDSPCDSSPRRGGKARSVSPRKGDTEKAAAKAAKKRFDERKVGLAEALLRELDDKVSGGQLARLSQSTGGVKIVWSKTLRSTAGRACWRRLTTTAKTPTTLATPSGSPARVNAVGPQHLASIELAEKVIDDEERLVSTLAHEYCHLTNYMVSGVRGQPHGESFKQWGRKVTSTFRHHDNPAYRKVEVTTKHNYEINHKYRWKCVGGSHVLTAAAAARQFLNLPQGEHGCGNEYGRHSKSIDPERHRCGQCRGLLLQIQPKPRKKVDPATKENKASSRQQKEGKMVEDEMPWLDKTIDSVTLEDDWQYED